MKRLFWLALGVTLGALIVRKLSKVVQRFAPQNVAHSASAGLSGLTESVRSFAADVRNAMDEREVQLRDASGLDVSVGRHALSDMASEPSTSRGTGQGALAPRVPLNNEQP